jgi:antitoxin ParD1/3/4
MATRNVVLTARQEALIDALVKSGRYQNASEVLRDGLRLVEQRVAEEAAKLEALRAAVREGSEDYVAGRFRSFSSPAELRRYLKKKAEAVLRHAKRP